MTRSNKRIGGEFILEKIFEESRIIKPRYQDYYSAIYLGRPLPNTEVPEQTIADFCKGCDMLQLDNICRIVGSNRQAIYVDRQWCGKGSRDGVQGEMTAKGFRP